MVERECTELMVLLPATVSTEVPLLFEGYVVPCVCGREV